MPSDADVSGNIRWHRLIEQRAGHTLVQGTTRLAQLLINPDICRRVPLHMNPFLAGATPAVAIACTRSFQQPFALAPANSMTQAPLNPQASGLTLKPQDISPLLWVVMGAAAISANAGTSLLSEESHLAFLGAQRPFVDGMTMLIWAWATWWIPMLFLFGFWKHVANRLPLNYEPVMWSFVFPLGMYAVASVRLGLAADFPPLQWISQLMIWVAFAAWLLTLAGVIRRLLRR